jgi:hypothetical protein
MSETSSATAARYETNRGFKSLPSLVIAADVEGVLPTAQLSPDSRERWPELSRPVGLSSEGSSFLLFGYRRP